VFIDSLSGLIGMHVFEELFDSNDSNGIFYVTDSEST
jgi:hypothetical protein